MQWNYSNEKIDVSVSSIAHKIFIFVGHIEAETKVTSDTNTEIHGLQKHANYSIQVWAYTHVGDGVKSNPVFCITDEAGKVPLVSNEPIKLYAVCSCTTEYILTWIFLDTFLLTGSW